MTEILPLLQLYGWCLRGLQPERLGQRRYTALTSSEDGTVRVWDTWNVVQKTVVKPTLAKPGRVTVSMARYNNDGHLIVAGLNNGTIQSWDVRGMPPEALWFIRPDMNASTMLRSLKQHCAMDQS